MVAIVIGRCAIGRMEYQTENKVTEVFIIRGLGSSYVDFNLKFFIVISLIAIVLYDWKKNGRFDYFLIALVCAAGIPIEAYIQLTGRRDIQTSLLFGMQMPYLLQLTLQSLADSSFDAVLMLFFADRMINENTIERLYASAAGKRIYRMLKGEKKDACPSAYRGKPYPSPSHHNGTEPPEIQLLR